jgi:formylglycine-generating enzyme
MSVKQLVSVAALAAVTGLGASIAAAQINIATVPIGNPGNAGETTINGTYGAVAYNYNIAATEVTNAQYTAFLNAVAFDDPNSLYNSNMAGSFGGITRTGPIGAFVYNTVSGRENNPVNFVSFWDAARFSNWLHNGQPMGFQDNSTTENGAYTLSPAGVAANTVTRNSNWQWAVASANEWYKAAYFQPATQGGDSDNYWLYPTSSNTPPTAGQANYLPSGIGNTVPVASYAANWAGVYDMGGNVYEWNETIAAGPFRGPTWGGAYDNIAGWLTPLNAYIYLPTFEREQVGFRVVSSVPTPAAATLLALGSIGALRRKREGRRIAQ